MLAGRFHGCNCVIDRCKCSCFCTTLRENARCILLHCIPPGSLSYARGHHGLHIARVMLSVRTADPLSGRRTGSWCGTAEKNHELFPGWEGGREVVVWRNRGNRRARLLPMEGRSAGPSTFASVFCAPLSSCLLFQSSFWLILWWSSSFCVCMLNRCFRRYSQVFQTPLHAYVEEGWARFFQLVYGWRLFPKWGIRLGDGCVSPFFTAVWCVCVVCVCVRTHTHTLHVGYSDVNLGVGTRHLESPEEIQMYCSDSIHIYRAVYEVHMYIFMPCYM